MGFRKSFALAISNLLFDKMRSILTMLGIIIGVAAVIILISLMNGLIGMVEDQFADFGTDTITVSVQDRGGSRSLDEDDIEELCQENTDAIKNYTPNVTVQATLKVGGDDLTSSVSGVNEEYNKIIEIDLEEGRFFNYNDISRKKKVCVIGTYIEHELFGLNSALGESIKINGESFNVVGVRAETDDSLSGSSDDVIYIPYTSAVNLSSSGFIGSYTIRAASTDTVDAAKTVIESFLDNRVGDSDYYNVTSMKDMLDMMNEMMGTMQTLLVCIAGISLLVGGIGIMNIMLVSVTERTREIGIRKSLGAKSKDIMSQFVIEAGTVSGVGGLIGIVVGSILAIVAGQLLGLSTYPSATAIAVSFSVSVGIGIIFGYLPAKNAAKLNPIDALRHE